MATVFTRIIEGEVPACFVWRDPSCVAFLNITPLAPGHMLVVPKGSSWKLAMVYTKAPLVMPPGMLWGR